MLCFHIKMVICYLFLLLFVPLARFHIKREKGVHYYYYYCHHPYHHDYMLDITACTFHMVIGFSRHFLF